MATLNFLWFDGIRGDSQDPRHIGDFDVQSFSYSASDRFVDGHGQQERRAQVTDVSFSIKTDGAGARDLFLACMSGKEIPTAILTVERSQGGRSAGVIVTFVMRSVLITSFQDAGSPEIGLASASMMVKSFEGELKA